MSKKRDLTPKFSPNNTLCMISSNVLSSYWYKWPQDNPTGFICKKAYLKENHKKNKEKTNAQRREQYKLSPDAKEKVRLSRKRNKENINKKRRIKRQEPEEKEKIKKFNCRYTLIPGNCPICSSKESKRYYKIRLFRKNLLFMLQKKRKNNI